MWGLGLTVWGFRGLGSAKVAPKRASLHTQEPFQPPSKNPMRPKCECFGMPRFNKGKPPDREAQHPNAENKVGTIVL